MEILALAETWVAVGLLIFLGILVWVKVPGAVAKSLDARSAKIQHELDEAKRIREEAEALLASLIAERKQAEAQAKEMLANAESEAKRMAVEAEERLEESLKRRQQVAERKIASAEAQAQADIKAAAADLAAQAAETILAARLAGQKSDPLIDLGAQGLAGKLQ
jgi:F-type H+-transporting ATPase subunit b